jgi:hypothetical protein
MKGRAAGPGWVEHEVAWSGLETGSGERLGDLAAEALTLATMQAGAINVEAEALVVGVRAGKDSA